MGCCGSSRRQWRTTVVQSADGPKPNSGPSVTQNFEWRSGHVVPSPAKPVRMIYRGQGNLVVVGPHTGRRYRFLNNGAVLEVDERDAKRMAKLRQLQLLGAGEMTA